MQENFDASFVALIGNEGGYSNNPADPGGETMYGITKRVAEKRGYTGDMHDLSLDLAKQIAKAEYWDPLFLDGIDAPLDFQIFDAAYNSGVERARGWLEQACKIPTGGLAYTVTGANLPSIVNAHADPDVDALVMRFDAHRLLFLDSLSSWPSFGRGWCNRIANNLLRAAG